jgi:hypothetical protein
MGRRPAAADHHLGALCLADLDIGGHAIPLLLRDQRPEVHACIKAVADRQLGGLGGDAIEQFVVDRGVGIEARAGSTGLALVEEDARRD